MKTLPSFDELAALAESDPHALEALRLSMSEDVIANASYATQPQLHAMLSHINRMIDHGKNPLHVNMLLFQALTRQYSRFATAFTAPDEHAVIKRTLWTFALGRPRKKARQKDRTVPLSHPCVRALPPHKCATSRAWSPPTYGSYWYPYHGRLP
ncbi:DUF3135 domain-containing protein [Salinivibrio sp. IB282]|uniref:DUF3135 domain-containing protein n=1 Tax=Salinivibrio sp. IB282 TaxID=1766122 RepID=UPI000988355A|nr:DUF3135 domain-containing protein [Salinivibrio sp. IB282]OOE66031.1 hypothetical protein BZG14_05550 [Salinivibrio sp. IB282]